MKKVAMVIILVLAVSQAGYSGDGLFKAGKMVISGQTGLSALGFGFGANFEFGITNNFGIMPSFIIHNYSSGMVDWSFKVADLYGTYHYKSKKGGIFNPDKMDAYGMAGISYVSFGASSSGVDDETSSNIAFGGGVGTRYYFNSKLSVFGEGKYRFASFKTDSYQLAISWYSIYVGVCFAIN